MLTQRQHTVRLYIITYTLHCATFTLTVIVFNSFRPSKLKTGMPVYPAVGKVQTNPYGIDRQTNRWKDRQMGKTHITA